jgi:hypothetical protein
MVDYVMKVEAGHYSLKGSEVNLTVNQIIEAMEIVGFQDQGKEKAIELIQEKFVELLKGNLDIIPSELIEQTESIISVVEYLRKIVT